jgi:hypothetical protein
VLACPPDSWTTSTVHTDSVPRLQVRLWRAQTRSVSGPFQPPELLRAPRREILTRLVTSSLVGCYVLFRTDDANQGQSLSTRQAPCTRLHGSASRDSGHCTSQNNLPRCACFFAPYVQIALARSVSVTWATAFTVNSSGPPGSSQTRSHALCARRC